MRTRETGESWWVRVGEEWELLGAAGGGDHLERKRVCVFGLARGSEPGLNTHPQMATLGQTETLLA